MATKRMRNGFVKWAKAVEREPYWFFNVCPSRGLRVVAERCLDDVPSDPLQNAPVNAPVRVRVLFLLLLAAGMRA
jgi:hypothetical protein